MLLTRKIGKSNELIDINDDRLEKIGSNCVNLLAGPVTSNLTYKDFSNCVISNAYFHKRDLTGCKFFLSYNTFFYII